MPGDVYIPSYLNRERLVHIADADLHVCEQVSVLFRLEGFQTAFSPDVASFTTALERRRPDIVVANLRLGDQSGLELLQRVRSLRAATPVFVLLDSADVPAAVAAIKAGAADVLTKPIDGERLLELVREALNAGPHSGQQVGRLPFAIRGFDQLTRREREVLQLITNGQSNKEAGRELGISPRTIEVHRARVMEKLGAKNTADLMRIVLMV